MTITAACTNKTAILACVVAAVIITIAVAVPLSISGSNNNENLFLGRSVLDEVPLIDGHNDLPFNIYELEKNRLKNFDLNSDLRKHPIWGKAPTSHTDIPRLLEGKLGAQFWVAYVPCETQYKDSVARTMEQIDIIKRMVKKYSKFMKYSTTSDDIMEAFTEKRIASFIAVEGGHSMDARLALLRIYYELGVRYMTLTHVCNTQWADASPIDDPEVINPNYRNVSEWGKNVILEMNRLGMMVDISHVSYGVMVDVIKYSKAPVIFSHSSSFNVFNHHRNVKDDILNELIENNGIIMINFYTEFIGGNTIDDVVVHLNHVKSVTGPNHIGIGGDYDGVEKTPIGLEDVSKYPDLFDILANGELINGTKFEAWTKEELKKLAGLNLIRVLQDVESVRDSMSNVEPYEHWIPKEDLIVDDPQNCMSDMTIHDEY